MSLLLAIVLSAGFGSSARAERSASDPGQVRTDGYQALDSEASAIIGELKYQRGDYRGARRTYERSLSDGAKGAPGSETAAFDLFRLAEIAMRDGDHERARKLLKSLAQRYPGTEWETRARRLLGDMPGGAGDSMTIEDAPFVGEMAEATSDEGLTRLRRAVAAGQDDQALGEAYEFIRRHPGHPQRAEVELAAGALHLRRAEPDRAAELLEDLARGGNPRVRSRAIYLLGGALSALLKDAAILREIPAVDPASSKDRWLALAQIWRAAAEDRLGQHDAAAAIYRAFGASRLDSPLRAYALAAVAADWDRRGKADSARDALVRADREAERWRIDDLRDALSLASANALSRARRYGEAEKAYSELVRRFPNSPLVAQAMFERGLSLKKAGRIEDAVKSFRALVERDPDSAYAADAHLQLGQLNAELGRSDESLSQYRQMAKASEAKDADREALLLMAQVHYNAKRFAEAIPLYRRYLQANPDAVKVREVQGLLLVALWQSDRTDPELAQLATKIPEHPLVAQIRWQLAVNAYKRGDWASAADLFKIDLEQDPRGPRAADACFYRAEALRQLKKSDEAATAYRRFLHDWPSDARAGQISSRLGAMLYEAKDFSGAADAYGKVTKGPGAAAAAYDRALAIEKGGRDSTRSWEDFAKRFPTHHKASWAWSQAARLREDSGDVAGAIADYGRATGAAERCKSLYAIGRLEEKRKRPTAAQTAYAKLRDAGPADDPARMAGLLRLGLMLELAEKGKQAAPLYQEVIRSAPGDSTSFDTARKRLEALRRDSSDR